MKKIIIGIIIIVLIVIGVSLNSNMGSNETIKIGSVISLTGFAAPWGEYAKNGMELAVKNINDKGGIDGRKVELVIEDDHTDGKEGVSAYNKLVSVDKIQGVIGGVFDFTAQPLIPLALNSKLALISGSNFRIAGGFDLNEQTFVMFPDFNKVLRELKTYIQKENIKKLAVVHFQSTFGNEIAKTLDGVMKENGQSGIINEEYAKIGDNNFRTTIAKLKAQGVEAVFLDMVGNDPVNFLIQSKQLGFKPKFIGYNGLTDSFTQEKDKSILEGVVILNWEVSSAEFIKLYKTAYTIEPTKSADKYFDAVYVLANAIANSQDQTQVASYISKNSFITPNGTIKFTSDHAVENVPVEIQVIKNGVATKY
jgi:branched-chain amino acid transport system substrate-binding protein